MTATLRRAGCALVIVVVLAGCSSAPAGSSSSTTANEHEPGRPSDGPPEGSHPELLNATMTFKALFYNCVGPSGVLEWEPLWMDFSQVVGFDLNLTWDSDNPFEDSMAFAFTNQPQGPPFAKSIGVSTLRWRLFGDQGQSIQPADRLEAVGPSCAETLPISGAIDIVVRVQGTFWME